MIKCSFCETENEDGAKVCVICGSALSGVQTGACTQTDMDDESGACYSVLMTPNNYKGIIRTVKKSFKMKTKDAKASCACGQIDGLTKAKAEEFAAIIRGHIHPARAVKTALVAKFKEGISTDKSWSVKIGYGAEKSKAVIQYFERYFGQSGIDEYLQICVEDGDSSVYQTDCKAEAEELAENLRGLGVEAWITEEEAID